MSCDCTQFKPLELNRESINKRIKESPSIRKRLTQIAENGELRVYLFQCPVCTQIWQSGHEWNFADSEYLFQVPAIEISEWQKLPYQQPAAMIIYSAVMRDYFKRNTFETGDSPCRIEGCQELAIRFSVFCRAHHIESLQKRKQLPTPPVGQIFPPYYEESEPQPDTDTPLSPDPSPKKWWKVWK